MASGAYWPGTSADEVVVAPSGEVGSIGAYIVHQDLSAALAQDGVRVSLITKGKYKVEGNPYEPLGETARTALGARVQETYDAFVAGVARNRNVDIETVLSQFGEGRMISAQRAVELGMADRVGTLEETVNRLLSANLPPESIQRRQGGVESIDREAQALRRARAYLQFLTCAAGSGPNAEAFVFATRLTRLTRALASRNPERAIQRAAAAAPDWSSGTRIGDALQAFNDRHGRRGMARGAVVVILSDGWERDDPKLVGREMARLARAAYAVVWVNPLKGHPAYQPLAGGMQAALPHVDRFLPGHNLESLEELAGVLAGIERRHAA
jgi:hypothetical protein